MLSTHRVIGVDVYGIINYLAMDARVANPDLDLDASGEKFSDLIRQHVLTTYPKVQHMYFGPTDTFRVRVATNNFDWYSEASREKELTEYLDTLRDGNDWQVYNAPLYKVEHYYRATSPIVIPGSDAWQVKDRVFDNERDATQYADSMNMLDRKARNTA